MRKLEINETPYIINEAIKDFTIMHKASSNVLAWGFDFGQKLMFVQFKNGSSYMYSDVPVEIAKKSIDVDSIGKFISKDIVGKYVSKKLETPLLTKVDIPIIENNPLIYHRENKSEQTDLDEPNFY